MQSGMAPWPGSTNAVSRADRFGLIDDRHVRLGRGFAQCWATERRLPIRNPQSLSKFSFQVRQQCLQSIDDEFHRQRR